MHLCNTCASVLPMQRPKSAGLSLLRQVTAAVVVLMLVVFVVLVVLLLSFLADMRMQGAADTCTFGMRIQSGGRTLMVAG